jgi:hypothetical protein
MKGQELYSFKGSCILLGSRCHNTKNRVIDSMCNCNDGHKNMLGKYLKCLMAMEALCNYLCTCCCDLEDISSHSKKEYDHRCKNICNCCDKLKNNLSKKECDYINCDKIKKLCNHKSKTKKK